MPQLVATCAPQNVDASGQCTQVQWVEYAGGLPPLSAADGTLISASILGCWAIGFVVRMMRKPLEMS